MCLDGSSLSFTIGGDYLAGAAVIFSSANDADSTNYKLPTRYPPSVFVGELRVLYS